MPSSTASSRARREGRAGARFGGPARARGSVIVAFDIDGTITKAPQMFAILSAALRAAGHRVAVVTLRQDRVSAEETLRACKVDYDSLDTLPMDYDGDAVAWKVERLRDLGASTVFDDLLGVANQLDPGVVVFVPRDPAKGDMVYVEREPKVEQADRSDLAREAAALRARVGPLDEAVEDEAKRLRAAAPGRPEAFVLAEAAQAVRARLLNRGGRVGVLHVTGGEAAWSSERPTVTPSRRGTSSAPSARRSR